MRRQALILTVCCFALLLVSGCSTTGNTTTCVHDENSACSPVTKKQKTKSLQGVGADHVPYPPSAFSTVVNDAPQVQAAKVRIAVADAGIDKANAMYMPTASFDASSTLRGVDRRPAYANDPNNPYSYALTVRVPIYQGGRAESAVLAAQAGKRVAIESARDVSLSTTYELALALVDVDRYRNTLAILSRHEKRLRVLKSDVKLERDAGGATAVDINDVDRQLASLVVDRQQTWLLLAQREETLLRLNAKSKLGTTALADISKSLPTDDAKLLQIALAHNPRVRERNARIDVAQARVEQAKSMYNPNLALELSAGGDGNASSYDRLNEASAILKLSVPLFTGGARTAELQGSRDELTASTLDWDAARSGVRAALLSARNRLQQARAMLTAAKTEHASARRLLDGIQAERKLGERSVFDEIRTIGQVASAELNMNAARISVMSAEVTLAAEAGMLDQLLGVSQPPPVEVAAAR